jgi:hypothetical protein
MGGSYQALRRQSSGVHVLPSGAGLGWASKAARSLSLALGVALATTGCRRAGQPVPALPPKPVFDAGSGSAPAVMVPAAEGPAPAAPSPSVVEPPPSEPAPTFVVLHACDDKYDAEPECRPGKAVWSAWLAGLNLTTQTRSLLRLDWGGPGGVEWNPGAPLVAFVASSVPGQTRLKLAAGPGFAPVTRFRGYDVFFIPFEAWDAVQRGARADELPEDSPTDAITVVELRAMDAHGEVARGLFSFARGE